MKNIIKKMIVVFILILNQYTNAFSMTVGEEIDILNERLYIEYFSTISPSTENIYATQNQDGSWSDIDYSSKALAYWPPLTHLQRIKGMARLYAGLVDKKTDFAIELASKINNGLSLWEKKKPTSNNWWYQDIGKQKEFIPILILMRDDIEQNIQNALCSYLVVTVTNASGANLTDMATGLLVRGVVQRNVSYINDAVTKIASVGKIQNIGKDGVQVDNSYLFHNQQIFSINYNVVTLHTVAMWINMLRNLSFQFPEVALNTTKNVLLEGNRWMFRNDKVDWATSGRFISIPSALHVKTYIKTTEHLRTADSENKDVYDDFLAVINQEKPDTVSGNKYFYRAEYMVKRKPEYFYSVKMSSTRISGAERGNGQNLKGYWLGMGANCLMKDSKEYDCIFPLWDWTKVPGTTSADELPSFGFELKQGSSFSGGLTNGKEGIASMQINQRGILAKKSWFIFDNEVVCLGNGITGVTNVNKIFSTIEQRRLKGKVLVDGKEFGLKSNYPISNPKTIYHDSTLYIFPKSQNVFLSSEERTNNWFSISNIESKDMITDTVFNLWYDHGRMPVNENYCYITVPYINPDDIDNYTDKMPIRIVQATHNAHVVTNTTDSLTGVVFFTKGTVSIDSSLDLQVSAPCIMMIDQRKEPISLIISDPNQNQSSITVTLKHKKFDSEVINITLPSGNYKGNSVAFSSSTDRNIALDINRDKINDVCINVYNDTIFLSSVNNNSLVKISDITGKTLYDMNSSSENIEFKAPGKGVYILNIDNEVVKVLIK